MPKKVEKEEEKVNSYVMKREQIERVVLVSIKYGLEKWIDVDYLVSCKMLKDKFALTTCWYASIKRNEILLY